jgi:phenylalanyl-tRNA synthetase beta chain
MKVPLTWLKEYLPTKLAPQQIADTLTSIGLEVEGIQEGVLEIALTPNLAHCASIRGIARELAAMTAEALHLPNFSVVERGEAPIQQATSVTVENRAACPRYACRVITHVHVAPSPPWLKERIEQCGMRSVNNVVDITNLVLLEFGHPLHAFDFDRLEGRRIVVRNAKKGEKIVTLDGNEHYPTEETLLICDAKKPIALAGIMGSGESEVTQGTTSILLESAYFEPKQVRRAAKRMGIHSEGSYRFERGVDPNGVIEALERASSWICEIAGGRALQGVIDIKEQEFLPRTLSCRLARINQVLGTHLAMSEVELIYHRLGLQVVHSKEDLITVKVPTYRHDLLQEIDLIEEVARFYGYGNIHKKEKASFRTGSLPHSPEYLFASKVRSLLISEGLQEFLTCDLISPAQAALILTDNFPARTLIKLLNPHSVEQSVMRPSMLPGMLSVIKYNADHAIYSVAGFEVGRLHFTSKERYFEPSALAIVLTGERAHYHWEKKEEKTDFFDLKGIVENFFEGLKISDYTFLPGQHTNFHPGRQAMIKIENVEVGIMGEIHPFTLKKAGLEHPLFFAELNLDDLSRFINPAIKMKPLPQFPASARDWTVTVAENIGVGQMFHWIEQERSDLLESFSLLDVYRSDKLGSERKNVTFRFVYRDRSKTLSLSAVENEHVRITNKISEHLAGG